MVCTPPTMSGTRTSPGYTLPPPSRRPACVLSVRHVPGNDRSRHGGRFPPTIRTCFDAGFSDRAQQNVHIS